MKTFDVEVELPNIGREDTRIVTERVRAASFAEAKAKVQRWSDAWVRKGHYPWATIRNAYEVLL